MLREVGLLALSTASQHCSPAGWFPEFLCARVLEHFMATSQPLLMHWEKYEPKEKLHKKTISQLENYPTLYVGSNREQGLSWYLFSVFLSILLSWNLLLKLTQKSELPYQEENFGLSDCQVTTWYFRAIRLNEPRKGGSFSSLGKLDSMLPLTVLTIDRMEKNPPLLWPGVALSSDGSLIPFASLLI